MIKTIQDGARQSDSHIEGIYVESAPADARNRRRDPVVFIHGGLHGSWCFKNFQTYFAQHGWENHALNFRNHYHSAPLPMQVFIRRGSVDCIEDIVTVASTLESPPVLIAHGWGCIVAQKFAETNPLRAMVLLAPVVPAEVGVEPGDIPPIDANSVFPVPPFEVAREMFLGGLDDQNSREYYSLLCPESPRCILEATQFNVSVDHSKIMCPILALGAAEDRLVPPKYVEALAKLYGASFRLLEGRGHNLLLEPNWSETAKIISDWLESC